MIESLSVATDQLFEEWLKVFQHIFLGIKAAKKKEK